MFLLGGFGKLCVPKLQLFEIIVVDGKGMKQVTNMNHGQDFSVLHFFSYIVPGFQLFIFFVPFFSNAKRLAQRLSKYLNSLKEITVMNKLGSGG